MSKDELIDAVIVTRNSGKKMVECLNAIANELNINNVIIVDGGSTDNTLDLIKNHYLFNQHKIRIYIKPELSLFESRIFGYEQVETPIFAGIDSDCIIGKGWYKDMVSHLHNDVGVVEGGIIDHYSFVSPIGYEKNRGYTFNNLFRREAVKGIPMIKLITRDDNVIRYYVEQNGFKWHKSGLVLADHYTNPVRLQDTKLIIFRLGESKELLKSSGKSDRFSHNANKNLRLFLDAWYKSFLVWKDLLRRWFWHLVGWLHG